MRKLSKIVFFANKLSFVYLPFLLFHYFFTTEWSAARSCKTEFPITFVLFEIKVLLV